MQVSTQEYTTQKLLQEALHKIFPSETIWKNARKEVSLINPVTGVFLEVDLWIPNLNLCFEFQDVHHYATVWYSQLPLANIKDIDSFKNEMLHVKDETLISIPYWWEGNETSLNASIMFQRPDLLSKEGNTENNPIPLNPPPDYMDYAAIPDIGELMLASFPQSPIKFKNQIASHSWWIGEKYDGIRFCWHPKTRKLSGLELIVPNSINNRFPETFLDGEIWYGRGQFGEAQKLIFSGIDYCNWAFFRAVNFDSPAPTTINHKYETRYTNLIHSLSHTHPFLLLAPRKKCPDKLFFKLTLQNIINGKGEGAIMQMAESSYARGRSDYLFKFKAALMDAEALVLRESDKTIWLQLPNETIFTMETKKSKTIVKRGDIITFSYFRNSRESVPETIVRIRKDLTWKDVLRNWRDNVSQSEKDGVAQLAITKQESEIASLEESKNFFINFAKNKNFDFKEPENWYFALGSLARQKGAAKIVAGHKGSMIRALKSAFPDIGLEKHKFKESHRRYWTVANRRNFFINIGKYHKFDPLVPDNWYKFSFHDIHSIKGAWTVLAYYKGNPEIALLSLFPEIGLQRSKFTNRTFWQNEANRRRFFERIAKERNFDPLIAENWYSVRRRDLFENKGSKAVLSYYKGNLANALEALFPEVQFAKSQFSYWRNGQNGKALLLQFVQQRGFNPLVPENWYNITRDDILSLQGGASLISYYKGSHISALIDIFPSIGLEKSHFSLHNYWRSSDNRKNFFVQFAESKHFNPLNPEKWYIVKRNDIIATKSGRTVLDYYKGNLASALMSLFPDIGLKIHEFSTTGKKIGREYFIQFANSKSFDYTKVDNWHSITRRELCDSKVGRTVIGHFGGSHTKALSECFPELNFHFESM